MRIVINSERVIEECKKHFKCDCDGVDLENDGGLGTIHSHWDRSVLYNELMTASEMDYRRTTTVFTLALLEDSGWYQVDYQWSEHYYWGLNKGCLHFNGQCNNTDYFCT